MKGTQSQLSKMCTTCGDNAGNLIHYCCTRKRLRNVPRLPNGSNSSSENGNLDAVGLAYFVPKQ